MIQISKLPLPTKDHQATFSKQKLGRDPKAGADRPMVYFDPFGDSSGIAGSRLKSLTRRGLRGLGSKRKPLQTAGFVHFSLYHVGPKEEVAMHF